MAAASEVGVDKEKAFIAPASISHFVIRTGKYEETIEWYRKVFDTRTVFASDHITFLSYDFEHHRIAIVRVPDAVPFGDNSAGVDHIAFSMKGIGELVSTYERLKDFGVIPAIPINHGVSVSLYYYDPNGIKIEFAVDNTSLADGPESYFSTPRFAANPIGTIFDPETLRTRYHDGANESDLLQIGLDVD